MAASDARVGGVCGQQVRAWGWRGDAACTGRWRGVGVGLPPQVQRAGLWRGVTGWQRPAEACQHDVAPW